MWHYFRQAFFLLAIVQSLCAQGSYRKAACITGKKPWVHVVQYSAFGCPWCATFLTEVFPKILERYGQNGEVSFTVIDYADSASEMKVAAAIQGFKNLCAYQKVLYATQEKWLQAKDPVRVAKDFLQQAGLETDRFESYAEDEQLQNQVLYERIKAEKHKVTGFPAFIFKDRQGKVIRRLEGFHPWKKFSSVIEASLKIAKRRADQAERFRDKIKL